MCVVFFEAFLSLMVFYSQSSALIWGTTKATPKDCKIDQRGGSYDFAVGKVVLTHIATHVHPAPGRPLPPQPLGYVYYIK